MPPVSLATVYEKAYKASSSFSSTLRNAGNKSLGNLVQQFLPFTESYQSSTQNVIRMNNGILMGQDYLKKVIQWLISMFLLDITTQDPLK